MERLKRIKELQAQRNDIDRELSTLQDQIEQEAEAFKKPRKKREKKGELL